MKKTKAKWPLVPTCVIDHLDCVPELNLFIFIRFLIHDFLMLRHLVLAGPF